MVVRAPDFSVPTLADGNFTLSKAQGKAIVLTFWDYEHIRCQEEMPFMLEASTNFRDKVQFVGVHVLGTAQNARDFFGDKLPADMMIRADEDGTIAAEYSVNYTRTTFFLDAQGIVRSTKIGQLTNYADGAAAVPFERCFPPCAAHKLVGARK